MVHTDDCTGGYNDYTRFDDTTSPTSVTDHNSNTSVSYTYTLHNYNISKLAKNIQILIERMEHITEMKKGWCNPNTIGKESKHHKDNKNFNIRNNLPRKFNQNVSTTK